MLASFRLYVKKKIKSYLKILIDWLTDWYAYSRLIRMDFETYTPHIFVRC